MRRYLVKYNDNWADEMDIDGFIILNEDEYERFIKEISSIECIDINIGTNEEIRYDSPEEVLNALDIEQITDDQYNALNSLGLLRMGFAYDLYYQILNREECW